MQKLKTFQEKIYSDPLKFFLVVTNLDNGKKIDTRVNAAFLQNHNDDLSVYLNTLKGNYDRVVIYPRLTRGTSSVPDGESAVIELKASNPQREQTLTPAQPEKPSHNVNAMSIEQTYGLNGPQILEGQFALRENARLSNEVESLKKELAATKRSKKDWRVKADKLERKMELQEIKGSQEPGALDKILNAVAEKPESIPTLLGMFKGLKGGGPAAAAPPQNDMQDLTEAQQYVVSRARTMPPSIVEDFARVIDRYEKGDDAFVTDLRALFTPLKKVSDA